MTRPLITFIAAMAAAALTASSVSAQVYDVPVPEPQGFTSTSSKLAGTLSDAAGNTLYVIDHEDFQITNITGVPSTNITPKGRQWLLLDRTGKLLGVESFAEASADRPSTVVFFSARRILARLAKSNNVTVKEFVPADGRIQPRGQAVEISALIGLSLIHI